MSTKMQTKNGLKNVERIFGKIYQHSLSEKVSKKNVPYIGGKIDIVTDNEGLNIVTVEFSYVAEFYNAKPGEQPKPNKNYPILKQIINSAKTWTTDGPEAATIVNVDAKIGVNNFIGRDGVMVESMRHEGSFISIISADKLPAKVEDRAKFDVDMVINAVITVDADEENGIKEHDLVKGRIFTYPNMAIPVQFTVYREDGRQYFESLDASNGNPVFTGVRGTIDNLVVNKTIVKESAFGPAEVNIVPKVSKAWIIQAANPDVYDLDVDGEDMTHEELKSALAAYETHLATVKSDTEAYQSSKNNSMPAAATNSSVSVKKADFAGFASEY